MHSVRTVVILIFCLSIIVERKETEPSLNLNKTVFIVFFCTFLGES